MYNSNWNDWYNIYEFQFWHKLCRPKLSAIAHIAFKFLSITLLSLHLQKINFFLKVYSQITKLSTFYTWCVCSNLGVITFQNSCKNLVPKMTNHWFMNQPQKRVHKVKPWKKGRLINCTCHHVVVVDGCLDMLSWCRVLCFGMFRMS